MTATSGSGYRTLELFFRPESVVMIGATDKAGTAGQVVLENLLANKDQRLVYPVNPHYKTIMEQKCFPSVADLPQTPDLAVVVTPAETVAGVIEECGKANIKATIIISSGFKEIGGEGEVREAKIAEIAKKYRMRIIGPNCMGIIRPMVNLNTTFIHKMPKPGKVAFLSQSGALGAGILDWAVRKNLGFSAFVSLGSMIDVDFGDAIDFFGEDPETRSIIIYPESLGNIKKFMSAARGFARTKPIIALKPGRFEESAKAVKSHTGALVGEDLHYDAIFRRAGVVRVEDTRDLFNGAAILDIAKLPQGPSVAIITNGGGPGALAIDKLISQGGNLAVLSEDTMVALNGILPPNWSKSNPIDIREDADIQRYITAIEIAIRDPAVNGVIVIFTPQGKADAIDVAQAVIEKASKTGKPVLTAWIGADTVADARQLFYENKVPAFEFAEDAIKTYVYLWQYSLNLEMLYQTPEESPLAGASRNHLTTIVRKAARDEQDQLSQEDVARFLSTYRIPAITSHLAGNADEAAGIARRLGFPLVLKVASSDIVHKADTGGVISGINSEEEVRTAFQEILENVKRNQPEARINGMNVQKMVKKYDYELIIGAKKDDTCGPVIMFGLGGRDAEFARDFAVGLPPLNQILALRILEQTRIYKALSEGYRNRPPVNIRQLTDILVRVSDLVVDFPEISELDINPLAVGGDSAIALDARIILDLKAVTSRIPDHGHLIISPYPTHYITPWQTDDGRNVLLRPIKPEDEVLERTAMGRLSEESLRFRFFKIPHRITHEMLTRFCNIDYDREMTIIAEYNDKGEKRSVGNSRLLTQGDGETGEFAVLVADDFHSVGLGLKLMDMIIGIGREKGLKTIYGIALSENTGMINLAKRLGFTVQKYSEDEVKFTLEL